MDRELIPEDDIWYQTIFAKKDGDKFQTFIEDDLNDYELQAYLLIKDGTTDGGRGTKDTINSR